MIAVWSVLLPGGMVHADWQIQRTLLQNLVGPGFSQNLVGPEVFRSDGQSLLGPGSQLHYYLVFDMAALM